MTQPIPVSPESPSGDHGYHTGTYPNGAGIVLRRVRLNDTDGAPIFATAGATIWKSWELMK